MQPDPRTSPGRRFALFVRVLLIVVAGWCTAARAEVPAIPTPPHQAEPWPPPQTSLPKFLVSATATLFEQGLADPRDCDYRTIQVLAGSVWGGKAQQVTTSGWVLPVPDGERPEYAIAWSGLVYPLAGAGGPADLDADVRALGDAAGAGRANVAPKNQPVQRMRFNGFGANNEEASISVKSLHPIKVCLLLRLGRADLAEVVWAAGTGLPIRPKPAGATPKLDLNSYGQSYLSLANDLAWYHFDRAICAHMRGDDPLALADVRALDALALAVDAKAEAMGFTRPDRQVPTGQLAPYIGFLEQLPEFRDDQERRARERANPPPPVHGEGRQARVAALIRDLDQVAARQWSQPGGVVLGESPIVKDLIAEGDAAVEPLIRAFRFEDRLTRSVGFHRDFFPNRAILRADQAAYTALTGILKTTNFAPPDPNEAGHGPMSREALANQIQAYWERNRAFPVVERWYQALADDAAGDAAWLEAAGNIIQPENVRTIPGGGPFVVTETIPAKPGAAPVPRRVAPREPRADRRSADGPASRVDDEDSRGPVLRAARPLPDRRDARGLGPGRGRADAPRADPDLPRALRPARQRPRLDQSEPCRLDRPVHRGPRQGRRRRGGPRIRRMGPDDLARLAGAACPGNPGAAPPPARRPDPCRRCCLALRRPAIRLGSADRSQGIEAEHPRRGADRLAVGGGSGVPQDAPRGPRRPLADRQGRGRRQRRCEHQDRRGILHRPERAQG